MSPEDVRSVLRAELRAFLRQIGKSERRLFSKRAAAQRLGIDRGTTLEALIRSGQLRTIVVAGKVKIPASEIERLEDDATRPLVSQRSLTREGRKMPRLSKNPGAAIRALKIG